MNFATGVLKGGSDDEDCEQVPSHLTQATAAMSYSSARLKDGLTDDGDAPAREGGGSGGLMKKKGLIKRVKSSDMLRMQIDEMMYESEEKDRKIEADRAAERAKAEADLAEQKARFYAEVAEQKARADADRAEEKARADREREYLRSRINELRGEVREAEKAKAVSDAKLRSASSNDLSIATGTTLSTQSEEQLKKQVDDGVEERRALEEQIAALQAEMEEAAKTKEAAAKRDKDAADEAKLALQKQVNELRREVEEAAFSKYLLGQELEEAKRMSSDSNSSTDDASGDERRVAELEKKLQDMMASKKSGDDAGAAREAKLEADAAAQKRAGDAREKELRDRLTNLLEQFDEAAFKKSESDEEGRAVKEGLQRQILALQEEVASAMSAKKKSDDEKDAAVSAKIKSDLDKNAAVSELDKMKENNSSSEESPSSEELSDLRKQLFKMKAKNNDLRTERALIESFAIAREEEDRDEMDRALEEKAQEVEALRAEMKSVVTAKLEAERERDVAMSETLSSVTGFTDERALALQIELEELLAAKEAAEEDAAERERELEAAVEGMKVKRKEDQDTGAAREKELQDKLENLLESANEAKSRKLISDGKHKAAMDDANAKEDQLMKRLKFLQEEVETAVFQKHLADEELGKMKSSSASQSDSSDSSALVSRLKASENEVQALKDAAVKNKTDRDDELKASLDEIQALKDAATKAKADSKSQHKAEIDDLHEQLRAMQSEVESAVFAKILAESEMDKATSSEASVSTSSSSDAEKIAMLRKELYDAKIESKAREDAGAARERKLAGDLQTIKEEANTAALANKEELDRTVKALQDETQARVDAEEGLQRAKSDSASSGANSSDAHLSSVQKELDDLKASKGASDRAGAARERKLKADVAEEAFLKQKLEDEKTALLAQLEKMQEDVDKAAFDKKISLDEAAAADEKMQQRVKFLQEEMDAVMYQKHISDMEVDKLKTSSGSRTESSESDEVAAQLRAENDELKAQKKFDQDKAAQDKTWADDTILQLKEELSLLQEQAAVLSRGKDLAEGEVRALKQSSDGSASAPSDDSAESILLQKIEQLRSEKQLSYSIASTMKRQLEAGKKTLEDRLDAMTSAKKEADDKLDKQTLESSALSERLHKEIGDLMAQKEADGLELQNKVASLETDLRRARSSSDSQEHVEKLMQDLAEMKSEKDATAKRLAWEKSTKRDLRQQMLSLQQRAKAADRAKQAAEDELKELQEHSETQTSESMEEVAERLKQQVQSLQEEKGVTLHKLAELEEAVATGELDYGEGGRVREAYVGKLKQDIEKLETSVDNLSNENKLLLDSKMRLEGEMGKDDKIKFSSLDDEINSLSRQTRDLTRKLDNTRKEADDAKIAQKEEKDQVLDLQARMDKTILQLATLKSSNRVNMERIKGEHEEELKAAKDSSASLIQAELESLRKERDELRKELSRNKEAKSEFVNDELKDALKRYQEENSALKEKEQEYEEEICRLKHSLNEANVKNHDLEHNIEAIKSKDEIFLSRIEREAEAEKAGLKKRIEMSEKAHADRLAYQEKEIFALKKELESETKQRQNIESKYADLKTAYSVEQPDQSPPQSHNGNSQLSNIHVLEKALEEEKIQRRTAEREAVSLKESMEQYDTTMDHMRREMLDLRSTKDETTARLKEEVQRLQKENQAMRLSGAQMPAVLNSREGPESNDLISTIGQDLDSLILDLQGPPSTMALNSDSTQAQFVYPPENSHASESFRSSDADLRVTAVQENHFVSSMAGLGHRARLSSTSVSIQHLPDVAEELERINSIANHFKFLYESKCIALKETQLERDALRLELQRHVQAH